MTYVTLNMNGELVNASTGQELDYASLNIDALNSSLAISYSDKVLSDYSNEIFINYLVKLAEWRQLMSSQDIPIATKLSTCEGYLWNDAFAKTPFFELRGHFLLIAFIAKFSFFALLLTPLLLFKSLIARSKNSQGANFFAVIRSEAAYQKITKLKGRLGINLISEDIAFQNTTMNSLFAYVSVREVSVGVGKIIKSSIQEVFALNIELRQFFGPACVNRILLYYASRVILKCGFEYLYEVLVRNYDGELVTANKEDRYAMVEKKIARKCGRKLVCVPHGLEYSFKMPAGLPGDVFYCTSRNSASVLSKVYEEEEKFVFDAEVNKLIYCDGEALKHDSAGILFLTEPRNSEVNQQIIDILSSAGISFVIKLHPNDNRHYRSKGSLYTAKSMPEAQAFDIWLARKSTVLLDAAYTGKQAIAILLNHKDAFYADHVFPSLSIDGIQRSYDAQSLIKILENKVG